MSHKIIVRILKDGSTEVKVEGHAGAGCTDLTKALEKALGSTTEDKKTDEYYQQEQSQDQNQWGNA
jgi:acylphosphatase